MTWLIAVLFRSRAGRVAGLVVLGLLVAQGVLLKIRADERARIEAERARDYIETRRDMDNADIGTGNVEDDLIWLRSAADRMRGPR